MVIVCPFCRKVLARTSSLAKAHSFSCSLLQAVVPTPVEARLVNLQEALSFDRVS